MNADQGLSGKDLKLCVASVNHRVELQRLRIEMNSHNIGVRETGLEQELQELQLLTQKLAATIEGQQS